MALYPGAVQRPVAAHGGHIGTILGTVIHVTAGEGDPYNEFANPNNQVSSHFGIGNGQGGMADGLVEQYVDTANTSWAQAAGNSTYLSVETEGVPTEALTQAQIESFGKLMAWMYQAHGVPLVLTDSVGTRGLITHGDGGAAWGGHTGCPGSLRAAQRQDILNVAIATLFHPGPIPTAPPKEGNMTTNSDGSIVYAAGTNGHMLQFSRSSTDPAGWSVIDITQAVANVHPGSVYTVQP